MTGTALRLSQLRNAKSGRLVIIAFDHGGSGVAPGGGHVLDLLNGLCGSRADGLLLGPGLAKHAGAQLSRPGAPRLIQAVDAPIFSVLPGEHGPLLGHHRLVSALSALRAGATMIKVLLPVGLDSAARFADSLGLVAGVVEEAHGLGLPVMVEPALWGPQATGDDDLVVHTSRVAVELGADLLKIPAPESHEVMARIVEWSPVPVVVLGGSTRAAADVIAEIERSLEAGAIGVAVGRNVWSRPDPLAAVDALSALVHDGDRKAAFKLFDAAGPPAERAVMV